MAQITTVQPLTTFTFTCNCGWHQKIIVPLGEYSEQLLTCGACFAQYFIARTSPSELSFKEKRIVRKDLKEYTSPGMLKMQSPIEQEQFWEEVKRHEQYAREYWNAGKYHLAIDQLLSLPSWRIHPIIQQMGELLPTHN